MRRRLRARGERGAVLVEFAFVMPILMLLFLVMADFALAELSDAAGSNAAREGARVGILYYDGAHTAGSANYNRISAAVTQKLANNLKGAPTVTVRCLNPDGTARPSGGSCSTVSGDAVAPGHDLIEVSVTWTRKGGITGFVGNGVRTDKAVMRIVGTPPTGGSSPPTCTLTASSANPATVVQTGGAIPAITFSATVSDVANCGTPLLTFPVEAAYAGAQTMQLVSGGNFTFTMLGGQGSWAAGTKSVTVSANGGAVTDVITFVVADGCGINSGTASPSTATQIAGELPAITFDVTVSSAAICGTPTLSFPAQAGYGAPQAMSLVSGNDFRFTMPANQGSWTAASYTIVANAAGGATRNISLVVSNPAVCTLTNLTISPSVASVKKNGQQEILTTVTITVTRSSTMVCLVPTVSVTPGASGPAASATDLTTPKPMHNPTTANLCTGLTCEWVIASGERNWYPSTGNRTVTVTASGSTVTGTLALT